MLWEKYSKNRRLRRQIERLTEAERQAILEKSPLEAGWFQGAGYHVFLKAEPNFNKAYVQGLGGVSQQAAEDWIIQQYLLANVDTKD
ncbi:hypothetical protein [Spirosoma endbachense]|uniref:Uncharacterized protein n=1 Tax=Spirosoma endbachense TaxID=2666025 RepID=A0A6P1W6J6_9BACT|nr:hypothetical protein [Spirosoma endbachense]QHV99550.1 hypothetical protein GJR95_33075 [Spirosoma endbachense]